VCRPFMPLLTEFGRVKGMNFAINMSRLTALTCFSPRFSTELNKICANEQKNSQNEYDLS
jgi:hypothetical protein